VASQLTLQEERVLSPIAFRRLLSWLDDGRDSNGETYLEMRRRLAAYFDRRNRLSADELADETLNRVARTLEVDGAIATTPPARYCYVIARFVLLEDIRRERALGRAAGSGRDDSMYALRDPGSPEADAAAASREFELDCLDRCLAMLKPDQRELAIEYYRDSRRLKIERRQSLARRFGITMNALAIRASRIRATLETSMSACRQEALTPPAKAFAALGPMDLNRPACRTGHGTVESYPSASRAAP
jgi:DNA-directed RNA polymerase specialized sigma24 family protein